MDKKQDLEFGIPNSELLPLESPWQFHEQKFGIQNKAKVNKNSLFLVRWRDTTAGKPEESHRRLSEACSDLHKFGADFPLYSKSQGRPWFFATRPLYASL